MSIIIGADFVPTKSNYDLFESGSLQELLGDELSTILAEADYRIFNLESPLTDKISPIKKCGPNLRAPTNTVNGYVAAKVDLFTLANNHILDQGENGLQDTCKILSNNKIKYLGAGVNLSEACTSHIFSKNGKYYGIYGCVEHEFSYATIVRAGANPFDPLESFDQITNLSKQCSYTIVLYHGGKELYRYPSPYLQKVCRKMIEKGADLVICQHSHCLGCYENYRNGTIIYGQGNFLFDYSNHDCWKTGTLIRINDNNKISFIPIAKADNKVRLACGKEAEHIISEFEKRSDEIQQEGFVEAAYDALSKNELYRYFYALGGKGRSILFHVIERLLNRTPDISKWYKKSKLLNIQNAIECEAHRELIITGIRNIAVDK